MLGSVPARSVKASQFSSQHLERNGGGKSEGDWGARKLDPDGQGVSTELLSGEALSAGGSNRESHGDRLSASVAGSRDGDSSDLLVVGGVAERVTTLVTVETSKERGGQL
jgi:hypothetical protein